MICKLKIFYDIITIIRGEIWQQEKLQVKLAKKQV